MIVKTAAGAAGIVQKSLKNRFSLPSTVIGPAHSAFLAVSHEGLEKLNNLALITDYFSLGELQLLRNFTPDLEALDIAEVLVTLEAAIDFPLTSGSTFRVSCDRHSQYIKMNSAEIERRVGKLLVDRYQAPVSLRNYDFEVYLNFQDDYVFIGLRDNRAPSDKWFKRHFNPGGALQNHVANIMIEAAEVQPEHQVLDAFSGSGTIGINLLRRFPKLALVVNDLSAKMIAGSRDNFASAVTPLPTFLHEDITHDFCTDASYDVILGNTPFGLKIRSDLQSFHSFYRQMLDNFARILRPKGVIVLLVFRVRAFEAEVEKNPVLQLEEKTPIMMGGLTVFLYKLSRRS